MSSEPSSRDGSPAPDAKIDLNTIPYDAPLSFPEPSIFWKQRQNAKGANGTTIPDSALPDVELDGKWVIISGGNNGIGREAALQFATWGANVLLACRDPPPHEVHPDAVVKECKERAAAEGVKDNTIEWWQMDCASIASVEAFAKRWLDTGRPLDILCNNAGIGGSPGGSNVFLTKDGFEIIHQVNLLSHVLLTLRLLPSLAKAEEPRVVFTTSCFHYPGRFNLANCNGELGETGQECVNYYQNNKLWLQTWLTELQHRLLQHDQYKHITVNGVHPGYVNTGIWSLNSGNIIKTLGVKFLAYFLSVNPRQGAFGMLYVATSKDTGPNRELQGVGARKGKGGGRYFNRIWEETPMPHTRDRDCRLRVWRKCNDELDLQKKGLLDVLGLYADDLE